MFHFRRRKYLTYILLIGLGVLLLLLLNAEDNGSLKAAIKSFIRAVT